MAASVENGTRIPKKPGTPELQDAFTHNKSSPLHRLPPEIRNKILEYAVTENDYIVPLPVLESNNYLGPLLGKFVWGDFEYRTGLIDGIQRTLRFPLGPLAIVSLRLTCRQFYHELSGVFYRANTFFFGNESVCQKYLYMLPSESRRQIRHVGFDYISCTHGSWERRHLRPAEIMAETAEMLLTRCPSLERLIIVLGHYAGQAALVPPTDPWTAHAFKFQYDENRLRWGQGDRSPNKVIKVMENKLETIVNVLEDVNRSGMDHALLFFSRVEFAIYGSPMLVARVDGRTLSRSSSDLPNYVRKFEDKLDKANKAMQQVRSRCRALAARGRHRGDERNKISFAIGEGRPQMEKFSLPDLSGFRTAEFTPSQAGPKYDENNGLLLWEYKMVGDFSDILWAKGMKDIVCAVAFGDPDKPVCSFESVSRLANWKGVHQLCEYYRKFLFHVPTTERTKYRLIQCPLPKDVDAALRATGLLDYDAAPEGVLQTWQALLDSQDGLVAGLAAENQEPWDLRWAEDW